MTIVIIGGNFAALMAAKAVMKRIAVTAKDTEVVLVSPNVTAVFNPAAPLALVDPTVVDQMLFPIDKSLLKFSKDVVKYRHVQGTAESVDWDGQVVRVKLHDESEVEITYDYLVIATGARAKESFLKLDQTGYDFQAGYELENSRLVQATSVAVVGGGSTGVEVAGMVAHKFKGKPLTLYTGADIPLANMNQSWGKSAQFQLEGMGVEVVNKVRVTSIERSAHTTAVTLDSGMTERYDVVIDSTGVSPNTEFLDASVLDANGYVHTDEYLRVVGREKTAMAVGDVASVGNLKLIDLALGQTNVFENNARSVFFDEPIPLIRHTPNSLVEVVAIGPNGGVGQMYGMPVPHLLIWFFKGRHFLTNIAQRYLA